MSLLNIDQFRALNIYSLVVLLSSSYFLWWYISYSFHSTMTPLFLPSYLYLPVFVGTSLSCYPCTWLRVSPTYMIDLISFCYWLLPDNVYWDMPRVGSEVLAYLSITSDHYNTPFWSPIYLLCFTSFNPSFLLFTSSFSPLYSFVIYLLLYLGDTLSHIHHTDWE